MSSLYKRVIYTSSCVPSFCRGQPLNVRDSGLRHPELKSNNFRVWTSDDEDGYFPIDETLKGGETFVDVLSYFMYFVDKSL